jgi:3-hydroxyisobutyrate dehydrogenase-like beta-hydroxyacid dehydrogenase
MPIGLIGVGLMGLAMSQRLLEQGQSLIVYNRTSEKLTPLQGIAATIAETPQAVLGSLPEARSGELLVMVGGTPEQFHT